ncbi:MAG: DUF5018 domain-containing protein, partial [Muribaculaceae bacterium]|nr:DUF5018 domain-containing protein [Muribaculaceae bacterium]
PAPLTPNWSYVTRSNDVIEFNGTQLLATTNGYSSNGNWTYRLYVADITMSPNSKSLGTGLVFDSRDGNAKGNEGVPGTGVTVTGMSSGYSFTTGTVLGKNATEMNDVIFARSEDGTAVQVYMLVSDQALIAYEITCFDI